MKTHLLTIIVLFLLTTIVGCVDAPGSEYQATLHNTSKLTGLQFPKSSKMVGGTIIEWQDISLYAKIDMSRTDLTHFLASVPRPQKQSSKKKPYELKNAPSKHRWDLDSCKNFMAITVDRDHDAYRILVALDDPKRAVIYLNWFGE
jgi:hypothetical protein